MADAFDWNAVPRSAQLPAAIDDPWGAVPPPGGAQRNPRVAQDIGDHLMAGLEASSGGLIARGELPDIVMGADAPWYHRAAYGVGGLVGDAPAITVGAIGGSLVAPGVGTMAGSFAAPTALREALVAAYKHEYATTWEGVVDVGLEGIKGGLKGATIGAVTFGAGRFVGPLASQASARLAGAPTAGAATGAKATTFAAEIAALTGTGSALEGRMPSRQEFLDNALLLGGVKGVIKASESMMRNFAETGKTPAEQVNDAMNDPVLREQILKGTKDGEVPDAYKALAVEERVRTALDNAKQPKMMQAMLDTVKDTNKPLSEEPVRYEYITDAETAQGVIQAASRAFAEQVEAQRRGTVPTAKSVTDGQKMVEAGLVKPHEIGKAPNDAEIVARAVLTKGAAERAQRIADEISRKDPAEVSTADQLRLYGAMEQVGLFYSELAGSGAELGRAMRMLREVKRDPGMLGNAEAMVKQFNKRTAVGDLTTLARSLKDPAQMAKFADTMRRATPMEKVTEVWKAAILSGFKTPIANILGNVGRLGVEQATAPLEASLGMARSLAKGEPVSGAVFKARALAPIIGTRLAVQDGMRLITEVQNLYKEAKRTGDLKHVEDAKALMKKVWQTEEAHLDKYEVFQQANVGKTGMATKAVFDVMLLGDIPFRTVGERAKAYELAVERAVNEKYTPGTREFDSAVQRYTEQPTAGLAAEQATEVTNAIRHAGAEYVFAEPLGPRMNKVSQAVQGSVAEFIFPFRRTPINIMSWALQHMPGLNLLSSRWRADFAAGGAKREQALARVVIGTALAGIGYEMAAGGQITGGGLFRSSNENRVKRAAGRQPYSFVIGEEYYSFQRLEPVARVFSLAADMYELMEATDDPEVKDNIGAMLVLMFGNATVSTTYMSGVANAMNAVADPARYGGNWIEQYAASLVPKAVGQAVTANDPYKREVDGVLQAIQSQMPFLREKLLPVRDIWGELAKNENLFTVLPIAVSRKEKDTQQQKVKDEAARLTLGIGDAPKAVAERGPFKASARQVELTQEQRDIWRKTRGETAMKILMPIVNGPDWEGLPAFVQTAVFKRAFKSANDLAKSKAAPADSPLRMQKREDILRQVQEQIDEAGQRMR